MVPGMLLGQPWNGESNGWEKQMEKAERISDLHPREAWGPQPTAGWQITGTAMSLFYLEHQGTQCFHR